MSCLFSFNWLKMGNSWYTEHISYGIVLLNWCFDEPLAGFPLKWLYGFTLSFSNRKSFLPLLIKTEQVLLFSVDDGIWLSRVGFWTLTWIMYKCKCNEQSSLSTQIKNKKLQLAKLCFMSVNFSAFYGLKINIIWRVLLHENQSLISQNKSPHFIKSFCLF